MVIVLNGRSLFSGIFLNGCDFNRMIYRSIIMVKSKMS